MSSGFMGGDADVSSSGESSCASGASGAGESSPGGSGFGGGVVPSCGSCAGGGGAGYDVWGALAVSTRVYGSLVGDYSVGGGSGAPGVCDGGDCELVGGSCVG